MALHQKIVGAWMAVVFVGASIMPAVAQDAPSRARRVESAPGSQAPQPAQQPAGKPPLDAFEEPIELSTDLVNVLFSVTDRKNRFVDDVTEQDLVITENGERQQIFSFRRERNLPLQVAVLIDVSSSQEFTFDDEKRFANEFLQKVLRPKQDSAAILRFRDDIDLVQGFTSRLPQVTEQFNRLTWDGRLASGPRAGATALYDAISVTVNEIFPEDAGASDPNTVVRRAIILLSDGADTASGQTIQGAIDDALRQGVIVYSIGVGDRYRSTSVKRDVLEVISEQTGGRSYFPTSPADLGDAFKQIEEELRSQYVLAYEPSQLVRDGSFREIRVSVPGRPDVKVFHRRGYFAPKPDPGVAAPGTTPTR